MIIKATVLMFFTIQYLSGPMVSLFQPANMPKMMKASNTGMPILCDMLLSHTEMMIITAMTIRMILIMKMQSFSSVQIY